MYQVRVFILPKRDKQQVTENISVMSFIKAYEDIELR